MKTSTRQDIVPIFDMRDGMDCAHLQFKTWTDMGLPWNSYCERSITGSRFRPESLGEMLAECARKGETVIAAAFHNYGTSLAILIPKQKSDGMLDHERGF